MTKDKPTLKWDIVLAQLSREQQEEFQSHMRQVVFAPRCPIFRQGEASETVLIQRSGRVRLYLLAASGAEFTTGVTTAGTILGLAPGILGVPRYQSAEAIDHVHASVISVAALSECMEKIPRLAINLARLLATLSVESTVRSGPLALDSISVRLANTLATLGVPDQDDPTGERLFVRGLTQEDLAKMVGATRTWVALTLTSFERLGLIRKKKGEITIPKVSLLAAHASAARRD